MSLEERVKRLEEIIKMLMIYNPHFSFEHGDPTVAQAWEIKDLVDSLFKEPTP